MAPNPSHRVLIKLSVLFFCLALIELSSPAPHFQRPTHIVLTSQCQHRLMVPFMTRRARALSQRCCLYSNTTNPTSPPHSPPVARAVNTDPAVVKPPFARYSHGSEVPIGARLVFVSGQLGINPDGSTPQCAEAQAKICLRNIRNILGAAQGQGAFRSASPLRRCLFSTKFNVDFRDKDIARS